jgi:hypothetical protein
MTQVYRVLPVYEDDMRRIKQKYESKKPIWGRGHVGGVVKKHSDELVAHIRWMRKEHGWSAKKISRVFGINESTVEGYLEWRTRANIEPARSIHSDLIDKS